MKKGAVAIVVLFLLLAACVAFADDTLSWDFNSSWQGWGVVGTAGRWVNPIYEPYGPTMPDGFPTGGGAQNLYLPDRCYARYDNPDSCSFVYESAVYIPRIMTPYPFGYPGPWIAKAGIQLMTAENKSMYLQGTSDGGFEFKDGTNLGVPPPVHIETGLGVGDSSTWWDQWITMKIDYNHSTPGRVVASVYLPYETQSGPAGWRTIANQPTSLIPATFTMLQVGGQYSYSQSQWDNISYTYAPIPEPASLFALMGGLAGMAGYAIRRRK